MILMVAIKGDSLADQPVSRVSVLMLGLGFSAGAVAVAQSLINQALNRINIIFDIERAIIRVHRSFFKGQAELTFREFTGFRVITREVRTRHGSITQYPVLLDRRDGGSWELFWSVNFNEAERWMNPLSERVDFARQDSPATSQIEDNPRRIKQIHRGSDSLFSWRRSLPFAAFSGLNFVLFFLVMLGHVLTDRSHDVNALAVMMLSIFTLAGIVIVLTLAGGVVKNFLTKQVIHLSSTELRFINKGFTEIIQLETPISNVISLCISFNGPEELFEAKVRNPSKMNGTLRKIDLTELDLLDQIWLGNHLNALVDEKNTGIQRGHSSFEVNVPKAEKKIPVQKSPNTPFIRLNEPHLCLLGESNQDINPKSFRRIILGFIMFPFFWGSGIFLGGLLYPLLEEDSIALGVFLGFGLFFYFAPKISKRIFGDPVASGPKLIISENEIAYYQNRHGSETWRLLIRDLQVIWTSNQAIGIRYGEFSYTIMSDYEPEQATYDDGHGETRYLVVSKVVLKVENQRICPWYIVELKSGDIETGRIFFAENHKAVG